MSQKEKLLKSLKNNPKNVRFEELKKVLEGYEFKLCHISGSHHKFKKGSISVIIPYHKPLKEIYVKQVLSLIEESE